MMTFSIHEIGKQIVQFQKRLHIEETYLLGISLDKYIHFSFCFLGVLLFSYFKKRRLGLILIIIIALGKEAIDLWASAHYGPITRSVWQDTGIDLLVDSAGILSALWVSRRWLSSFSIGPNHKS